MSRLEELSDQRWFQVLQAEIKKTSISDVARQLGYSRPTISLVLSGAYNGGTDRIAAKVIAAFTELVQCPFLGCELAQVKCGDFQSRPMPTSDPEALRHWVACRTGCPNSFHSLEEEKCHA